MHYFLSVQQKSLEPITKTQLKKVPKLIPAFQYETWRKNQMFWQIQKRLIQNFNQFKSHCQRYRRSDRQRCHQLRLPFRKQHLFAQNWTFRQVRTDRSGYQPHYRKRPVERDQNLKITGYKNRPHATSRRRISIPLILIPYYPTIYQIHPYCRCVL